MRRFALLAAGLCLSVTACETDYPLCNDTASVCADYCHLVEICPNSAEAEMAENCEKTCPEELGDGGYGSWMAGWMRSCIDTASCAMFDSGGCWEAYLDDMDVACDGPDNWLFTYDGCTDRIDCVEFCLKAKHMGTAGCGVKIEDGPPVCICTDHPENY